MDMVGEFIGHADEPLEQAKIVATQARKIAHLPQYLTLRLICIHKAQGSYPDGYKTLCIAFSPTRDKASSS